MKWRDRGFEVAGALFKRASEELLSLKIQNEKMAPSYWRIVCALLSRRWDLRMIHTLIIIQMLRTVLLWVPKKFFGSIFKSVKRGETKKRRFQRRSQHKKVSIFKKFSIF